MNHHYLAVALITISTIGVTACANNYQNSNTTSAKSMPTSASSAVIASPSWSYTGNTGPEYWGDNEEASACKIGEQQSPINIKNVTTTTTNVPTIDYSKSVSLNIHDNGHTVVYTPTTHNNAITLNNERFELKQFHYHTPSEHQFGNQNYPAELHFVHANSAGNLAVVGVMLQQGKANDVMRVLLNGTQQSAANKTAFTTSNVDLSALISAMPTFYHYAGSLTTPPCSEKVQWYVSKQPLELAGDQLAILSHLYEGNNRPVQSQGSRVVEQISK
ncbi:carbonic anhydrase [Psychrobacter urativorans]|uniref:carbonic anhydrase n=1 Tax=Psychrobacter urativorans TaxID=45610 RepID=A0A0M5MLE1_9GAMM|nr:carbonic anhydrase family protein [Psychrobacter urativorans]ALF60650.1 hypothetical protein AOC03_11855 [Psychrobacter urativorans]